MKQIKTFLTSIAFLFSCFAFSQTGLIKKLYADTFNTDEIIKAQIIADIKKHGADTNTITSLHYTAIVAYKMNETYHVKTGNTKDCELSSLVDVKHNKLSSFANPEGKTLTDAQAKTLLTFFSTSDNFYWNSCSAGIPVAGFVFYFRDRIIGYINISCYFKQAKASPYMLQNKWGALAKDAEQKLIEFCKELGVYYVAKY